MVACMVVVPSSSPSYVVLLIRPATMSTTCAIYMDAPMEHRVNPKFPIRKREMVDCRNIIMSVLVLLSSWLLFVGRHHPRLLLGRAQRLTARAAASSVLQVGALLDLGSTGGRE